MFKLSSALLPMALLLWLPSTHALAHKPQDTLMLKEVAVVSRQSLASAMLAPFPIDSLSLSSSTSLSLAELIGSHSTLSVKSYGRGAEATASFRGSAASHTALQWNDIPLNSPMRGYADFSLFPIFFVDKIEMAAGGGALAKSSGAIGGLVSMHSTTNWQERLHLKYRQEIESFGTYKEFAQLGFGNGKIQSSTRVFHDQSNNNFPFYNQGVLPHRQDKQKNASYHQYGMLQELSLRLKQTQLLKLKGWYLYHHRDLPQLMSFEGLHRKEYQKDKDRGLHAQWQSFGQRHQWKINTAYKGHKLHYYRSSTEQQFENFNAHSMEDSFFLHADYQRQINKSSQWHSQIRSAWHQVEIDNKTPALQATHQRQELSVLQQINKQLHQRLSAYALLRIDIDKGYPLVLSPAVGCAYQLMPQHKLIANLSRNYHKPTLNDLYWVPGGNPHLKPEKALSTELAWQYEHISPKAYLKTRLNGFVSLTDDWIVWHPASNGAFYWEANNIKKVLSRGLEIYVNGQIQAHPQLQIRVNASYTYTATTNQNNIGSADLSRGKQLIYIPKQHANALLHIGWKKLYTQWQLQYTGLRYTTSSNSHEDYEMHLDPYMLTQVELGFSYHRKSWHSLIALRIHNLFNTDYMSILWRPMPGRYYSLNIQISCLK